MNRSKGLWLCIALVSACGADEALIEQTNSEGPTEQVTHAEQSEAAAESDMRESRQSRAAVRAAAAQQVALSQPTAVSQSPSEVLESRMPIDDGAKWVTGERPRHSVKVPGFRPATADEIESLNGTYRTEGSWDFLLRGIEFGRDEATRQGFIATFTRVQQRLPEGMRALAKAKMDAAVERVEQRVPRKMPSAIMAARGERRESSTSSLVAK